LVRESRACLDVVDPPQNDARSVNHMTEERFDERNTEARQGRDGRDPVGRRVLQCGACAERGARAE
jgi:hypothetical protein